MRMKKLVFSLLVAVVVLTSCREKEKPHNEEAVAPNQEVSLGILPYDGIAPEKQTLKLNVFVADVASNFSTDEQLAEKTKKRIIKGLEVKPSYSEINLVNKVDENTDVIIYGTVAKQTETKIDAQDVVIAYTINIVSANAKTGEIIQSISKKINPDLIIAIDALAAKSIDRLGTTIQITNTGISPGSGVENKRAEISKNTLNIPVIALGMPTVVDMETIISEMCPKQHLSASSSMMVTPRNIDQIISRSSSLISNSINQALFPSLSPKEISSLAS